MKLFGALCIVLSYYISVAVAAAASEGALEHGHHHNKMHASMQRLVRSQVSNDILDASNSASVPKDYILVKPLYIPSFEAYIDRILVDGEGIRGILLDGSKKTFDPRHIAILGNNFFQPPYTFEKAKELVESALRIIPANFNTNGSDPFNATLVVTYQNGETKTLSKEETVALMSRYGVQDSITFVNILPKKTEKINVTDLIQRVAKQLPHFEGASLISNFYPKYPVLNYFDEFYNNVSHIQSDHDHQHQHQGFEHRNKGEGYHSNEYIQRVTGMLNAIPNFIRNIYNTKFSNATSDVKYELIKLYLDPLVEEAKNMMRSRQLSEFKVFLQVANTAMALCQEQLKLTNETKQDSSSYARIMTIRTTGQPESSSSGESSYDGQEESWCYGIREDFVEYAHRTWGLLQQFRKEQLQIIRSGGVEQCWACMSDTPKFDCELILCSSKGSLYDNYYNETAIETANPIELLDILHYEMKVYVDELTKEMSIELAGETMVDGLINLWNNIPFPHSPATGHGVESHPVIDGHQKRSF